MAKDPAVLFYTADFMVGTNTFTNEQAGMYIRLLCHQHQNGKFTLEQAHKICGNLDEEVMKKFAKTKGGLYYNVRMEEETKKRKKFCETRRANALKGKECQRSKPKAYAQHMENENVNENVSDNLSDDDTYIGEEDMKKPNPPKSYEEVLEYAKAQGREDIALKFWEYFEAGEWHDSEGKPVLAWKQKFVTWKNRNEKPKEVLDEKERAYQKAMGQIHGQ